METAEQVFFFLAIACVGCFMVLVGLWVFSIYAVDSIWFLRLLYLAMLFAAISLVLNIFD
jgi:hypothetical protein